MARVFITGSSDGLGLMTGQLLADQGHQVVLHARNDARATDAKKGRAQGRSGRRRRSREHRRDEGPGGPDQRARAFRRNHSQRRRRLSRGAALDQRRRAACLRHQHARALYPDGADRTAEAPRLSELRHARARERESRRYFLAQAALGRIVGLRREQAARRHARVHRRAPLAQRAVECGDARLGRDQDGRRGAPDDIGQAHLTQAWLATSDDAEAKTTGGYFYHLKRREPNREAREESVQDRLVDICQEISGVNMPWS